MSGETSIEDICPTRFFETFKWDESGAIIVSNPVLTRHPMNPPTVVSQRKHISENCFYSTNYTGNCITCGSAYTQISSLRQHEQLMHMEENHNLSPTEGVNYEANDCRHQVSQPLKESEKIHKCEQCSYSTNDAGNIKRHRLFHTGEKPHQCPNCNEAFKKEYYLRRHLRIHTGERLSFCRVCGASFSNLNTLRRHELKWHTGGRSESPIESERKYKCEQCVYSTTNADNLKKHRLTHTGEKLHQCPNCTTVQRHFSCSVCGASFSEIESLHRHESRHFRSSGALTESERQLRYDSCPYSANRSNDNELTHTGEKPYKCPDCPRAFTRKETLEYHVRNHTRERLFSCHICQIKFTRLELLCQHERTHFEHHRICSTCMNDFTDPETFILHECEKYVIEDSKLALLGV